MSSGAGQAAPLRDLARLPAWRWWVLSCLLARLPITMVVVAMVLAGERLGSFSQGAALAAVASVASGLGAFWRARVMDRSELRRALARDLFVTAAGYAMVAVLVQVRAPIVVVGIGVGLASVSSSALFSGYRSMLTSIIPADLLPSAFAIDAVLVEVGFVLGPAIAGLISLWAGPTGVLAGMVAFGVLGIASGRKLPLRHPVPLEHGEDRAPHPWSDREVVANYVGTAAVGVSIGLFEAGFVPFAALFGAASGIGGLFSGVYAFGSGAAGLATVSRFAGTAGQAKRALVLLAAIGLLLLPLAVAPSLPALMGLLVVAGLPFATANAAASSHLQSRLHPARFTEGFAVGTTCILLGVAGGNGLASLLLRAGTVRGIYVMAAFPPVIAAGGIALWATTRRRPVSGV